MKSLLLLATSTLLVLGTTFTPVFAEPTDNGKAVSKSKVLRVFRNKKNLALKQGATQEQAGIPSNTSDANLEYGTDQFFSY